MQVAEFPANSENKVKLWGSFACFVVHFTASNLTFDVSG